MGLDYCLFFYNLKYIMQQIIINMNIVGRADEKSGSGLFVFV